MLGCLSPSELKWMLAPLFLTKSLWLPFFTISMCAIITPKVIWPFLSRGVYCAHKSLLITFCFFSQGKRSKNTNWKSKRCKCSKLCMITRRIMQLMLSCVSSFVRSFLGKPPLSSATLSLHCPADARMTLHFYSLLPFRLLHVYLPVFCFSTHSRAQFEAQNIIRTHLVS